MNGREHQETGYLHPLYILSCRQFGAPCRLPTSGATVLVREISGAGWKDCTSAYPLFFCPHPEKLAYDLAALEGARTFVSLTLTTDPLTDEAALESLREHFDVVRPYKEHHLVDLRADPDTYISKGHVRKAEKFLARGGSVVIAPGPQPDDFIGHWSEELYGNLARRKQLSAMSLFSREAFALQARIPGLTVARAYAPPVEAAASLVGACWFYRVGRNIYYHLGAQSQAGYELQSSFAMFRAAIEHFRGQGCDTLVLGAGSGTYAGDEGLSRFKRGWATHSRKNHILGKILDRRAYDELSAGISSDFFPAYRDTRPA